MAKINITINGKATSANVEDRTLLVDYIREHRNLTGTHVGCDTSQCGACVVHVDGKAVKSCTMLAAQASGSEVTTIEGIGTPDARSKVQDAWIRHQVAQCGYCQSGQIMQATALLTDAPEASDADIAEAMSGNLCRCGSYSKIRAAIRDVQQNGGV